MTSASGDGPKILEFPNAEVSPEERARRLKVEVERLASLPPVERLFYIECENVAEKHGVSRAAMKAMVEATIRENEKKAREDNACSASTRTTLRQNVRWRASRRRRNVRRSEPIKRLSASARSARKRSKRSPNYPAWRTRYALLNLRSGRAKTSTSCATNSRPITFRRISTPSLLSHGTSRLIRMHS